MGSVGARVRRAKKRPVERGRRRCWRSGTPAFSANAADLGRVWEVTMVPSGKMRSASFSFSFVLNFSETASSC